MSRGLATALFATGLTACAPSAGDQAVDLGGAERIRVENTGGGITLVGGSVSDTIFLTYEVHSDNGKASLADVDLVAGPSGGEFLVEALTDSPDIWVDIAVGLPTALPWAARTATGDVFLESLSGGGQVLTNSGFVSGGGLRGDLALLATTSEVSLQMEVTEEAEVVVDLEYGSMTLELPTPTHALLDAGTNDGFISISDLPFNGDLSADSAVGTLGGGGGAELSLRTTLGNIVLFGLGEIAETGAGN